MIQARYTKKNFQFKRPSGTSRGVLTEKHAWFIEIWNKETPSIIGTGECSIIPGLSPDFESFEDYENKLNQVCLNPNEDLEKWPSIKFGVECALLDLKNGGKGIIFKNSFSSGDRKIPINGLIWMGDKAFMEEQIKEKISLGFSTIKMKIGSIDFETEFNLLKSIREKYSKNEIKLRVDANGAFSSSDAYDKLEKLSSLNIHSIEQPIKAGQFKEMKKLCLQTSLKIALDEELIGVNTIEEKTHLLNTIDPPFIILKPSLHGGLSGCREWIALAEERDIDWWITSALESNVGLDAICQFVGEYNNQLPQGLGTGSLYVNNIDSDLIVEDGMIYKGGKTSI